jgi:hypothetical protein
MPAAIILSVYALAVARVTRIITADKITEGLRGRVIRWADRRAGIDPADPFAPTPLLSYFVTCPWCVSIYVGAVAAGVLVGRKPLAPRSRARARLQRSHGLPGLDR